MKSLSFVLVLGAFLSASAASASCLSIVTINGKTTRSTQCSVTVVNGTVTYGNTPAPVISNPYSDLPASVQALLLSLGIEK